MILSNNSISLPEAHYFYEFLKNHKKITWSFNNALNTFYLQLYGVRHMVKDQVIVLIFFKNNKNNAPHLRDICLFVFLFVYLSIK